MKALNVFVGLLISIFIAILGSILYYYLSRFLLTPLSGDEFLLVVFWAIIFLMVAIGFTSFVVTFFVLKLFLNIKVALIYAIFSLALYWVFIFFIPLLIPNLENKINYFLGKQGEVIIDKNGLDEACFKVYVPEYNHQNLEGPIVAFNKWKDCDKQSVRVSYKEPEKNNSNPEVINISQTKSISKSVVMPQPNGNVVKTIAGYEVEILESTYGLNKKFSKATYYFELNETRIELVWYKRMGPSVINESEIEKIIKSLEPI